jgi:hypothetical protein
MICAHCGKPITDDFVIGMKMIGSNTFQVFFHRNRPECVKASRVHLLQ